MCSTRIVAVSMHLAYTYALNAVLPIRLASVMKFTSNNASEKKCARLCPYRNVVRVYFPRTRRRSMPLPPPRPPPYEY